MGFYLLKGLVRGCVAGETVEVHGGESGASVKNGHEAAGLAGSG